MRHMVFSLVAAAALLASVGAAVADPVKLTDAQLDKATAGDATAASLLAASTAELNNLLTISFWAVGVANGVLQPLPGLTATP